MKLFLTVFPIMLLVSILSLIPVAKIHAQEKTKTTTRDHRTKPRANTKVPATVGSSVDSVRDHRTKPRANAKVPATVGSSVDSVRDHRTTSRTNTKVHAQKGSKTPKHYQLNAAGKFVPFNPPSSGKNGAQAKSSVNCAVIPCPSDFQKDITCWKCQKSEDKSAPKAGKVKKNE